MSRHEQRNWLENDRYAVYGLGRSGRAAARLLARRGKEVVASDVCDRRELADEVDSLPDSVEIVAGRNDPADADVVVVSPGLNPRLEVFDELRDRSIPAVSEIDLAFDAARAAFVAITGTDGKTTTTSMCGDVVERSGRPHAVAGNIGTPLCDVVDEVDEDGLIVAEVSAFQLWSSYHFRPTAAGFTNVAGDHLDYFETWDDYVAAKHRLVANSGADDWAAFNASDETVWAWRRDFPGRTIGYGFDRAKLEGCDLRIWADDGAVRAEGTGVDAPGEVVLELEAFTPPGRHNVSNAMCAAALGLSQGIDAGAIRGALTDFEPLSDRIEPCGEVDGVRFINDSKATNVNAALAGLESVDGAFVAIVGGVDKNLELAELAGRLEARAAGVVLIGELEGRLREALDRVGMADEKVARAETLDEAVEKAFATARSAGVPVILSPACSSFDMFDSYEHRGDVFRRSVRELGAR